MSMAAAPSQQVASVNPIAQPVTETPSDASAPVLPIKKQQVCMASITCSRQYLNGLDTACSTRMLWPMFLLQVRHLQLHSCEYRAKCDDFCLYGVALPLGRAYRDRCAPGGCSGGQSMNRSGQGRPQSDSPSRPCCVAVLYQEGLQNPVQSSLVTTAARVCRCTRTTGCRWGRLWGCLWQPWRWLRGSCTWRTSRASALPGALPPHSINQGLPLTQAG